MLRAPALVELLGDDLEATSLSSTAAAATSHRVLKWLSVAFGVVAVALLTAGIFMLLLLQNLSGLWPAIIGFLFALTAIILLALRKRAWLEVAFLTLGFAVVLAFVILLARLNTL